MHTDFNSTATARTAFWRVFAATLGIKLLLAWQFPITGDEAFFYQWGVFPSWGYSDHPPMVGWLLWLLRHLGDSPLALRSFTLLLTSFIALGMVDLARRLLPAGRDAAAWWAGAVYLALPFTWLFVLVTTDTPLIFFMALSAWCFVRAEIAERRPAAWYAAAGLLLGCAFLSKYFAVLLGLGYAVWLLGWRRSRWWALPLLVLCALPGAAVNLAFNATHGWTNIMFNVYNRNTDNAWGVSHALVYLGMMVFLLTPWLLWQSLAAGRAGARQTPLATRTLAVLWVTPLLVFTVVSLRRSVGLHWVLGFVPFFVTWAALTLQPAQLARSLRYTAWLSLPLLVLMAALVAGPLAWWQKTKLYPSIVFAREGPALVAELTRGMPPGAVLMARFYSPAAVLAYHTGQYVPVFGPGRFHARQDDQIVDFRAYAGKTLRVYDREPVTAAMLEPALRHVREGSFTVAGATYHWAEGDSFDVNAYRDTVLREIANRYHRIPHLLPLLGSPFCERYGFADCSPGGAPAAPASPAASPR